MIAAYAILRKKYREDKSRSEWALLSKKKPHKVLKWFGVQKPSDERVAKEEKRIQYFKHAKGSFEDAYNKYKQIKSTIKPLFGENKELYKQVKAQIKANVLKSAIRDSLLGDFFKYDVVKSPEGYSVSLEPDIKKILYLLQKVLSRWGYLVSGDSLDKIIVKSGGTKTIGQAAEEKFDWIVDASNKEAIQLERGMAQKLQTWIDFDSSTAMQFVLNKEASDITQNNEIVGEFKKKLLLTNSGKNKPLLLFKKAV